MAIKRKAGTARSTARHDGPRLYDDVLALVRTLSRDRMAASGRQILHMSEALRDVARALPDMPNLGAYAMATADSLDDAADYVSDSDIESVLRDASAFARHHPVMTVALAATAAVAAVHYFRSDAMRGSRAAPRGRQASVPMRRAASASIRKAVNGHARAIHA